MDDMPVQTKRIVILGGGFGGLYAALYLDRTVARDPDVQVTLIDPQNFTLFTPAISPARSAFSRYPAAIARLRLALNNER